MGEMVKVWYSEFFDPSTFATPNTIEASNG
jgi:hypothetical protein